MLEGNIGEVVVVLVVAVVMVVEGGRSRREEDILNLKLGWNLSWQALAHFP